MLSKKRLKKAAISVLTVIATLCMCFAAGCNKPEEKITLLDEADRPSAVVSREFDAMSIVSDTNGYELELTECFYLDGNMQRVNIEVYDGTKFVPTVEKEVMLTLKIKGGTFIKETTIKVEAPVSAIQEEFMGSWNDEGVGKTVTAQSEYLTEGAESVIKVKYMGSLGSTVSGPGIGGFYYNSRDVLPFSVTDWSNAVMVMDIYNPMDVNLVIYYCIIKDYKTWTSEITGQYGQQRYALLEAGTWTKAVLSLNMLGIDYNMYEKYNGNMYISFRASFETMPDVKPFEWTMYIANMDITDYSKERFPDLQTKRPDQILDEMDGDAEDKETYKHLLEENSDFRYANIKTEAKIVSYEAENLTKPDDNSGDYLNKYTVYANKSDTTVGGPVFYSTPLYYKNEGYFRLTEEQKKIDFSKAFLTFDVYNPNDADYNFYLVSMLSMYINNSTVSARVAAKSWTKVELPLTQLEIGDAYTFAASIGGIRTNYETLSYYIDNVNIVEKEVPVTEDKKLSDVETEVATHGSYGFNETNVPVDMNGVSWITVDNREEKEAEGKKFLQVKVNFAEFSTVSAGFAYTAGAAVYKFSFGYKHGDTTVLAYNNYQGNKTILGSMKFGLPQGSSGLRIYENGVKVVNHGSTVWSYYSTVNNYSSASGNMSTGTDYIFEFELEKCSGDMRICFGASSVIKSVEWKETDGVSGGGSGEDPEVPVGDDLAKNTLKHLLPENKDFRYAGIVTEGNIVTYKKENLTKPNEEASEFVNKYTIKANKEDTTAGGPVLYSAPLYYSNQGKYALTEEEKALDFATGEIRFDFYNPNSFNIDIYIANSLSAYITGFPRATAKANSWTKIALPLSSVSVGEEYSFAVSVGGNRMEYETLTYYIDNVEFGEKPADTTVTLSAAETEIATHGSYTFNATNNPVDENGVSWIRVDNKKEKETEGKKFLQVKVSFTEFSTVSAGFAYTAGAAVYKFSFGYKHDLTTVFAFNNYQGNKTILGSTRAGAPGNDYKSGLKVYDGETMVINHGDKAWSYYSTAGNYASANGNLSTGVDYVFEYDLTKCTGEMFLNFGVEAVIKSVAWKETSGVTAGEPVVEANGNLAYIETQIAANGKYNFNATNNPVDENGVSWIKVDNKAAKEAEGKKFLQIKVNFAEFSTVSAGFAYTAGAATYKFSFGYKHGDTTVIVYNNYQNTKAIFGTMKSGQPQGTSGLRIYQGDLKVADHGDKAWSYYSTADNYASANGNFSVGTDYVFEYDLTKCTGEMFLNFGVTAVIKSVTWE